MHLGLVPEFEGKLAAYKLFTPATMRDLQDEFFYQVSSKYDLERGRMSGRLTEGDDARKHKTAVELKSETLAQVYQLQRELVEVREKYQEYKKENEKLEKECHIARTMCNDYKQWEKQAKAEYEFLKDNLEDYTKKIIFDFVQPLIEFKEAKENSNIELAIDKITHIVNKFIPKMALYDDIYNERYKKAYKKYSNANLKVAPKEKGVAFLSEVVKVHGTNADKLFSAARDVAEVNGDSSPKNIQNLYMGATSTQSYIQSQQIGGKGVLSAFIEKLDGKYDKWANLSIPISTSNNDNLFDENLSETEKRDRQAQQPIDRY